MTEDNVFSRIAAAYQDIAAETFEKTGTVAGSGGGYKFIPIGQILNIVRLAHSKHGVIVVFGRPMYDAAQGEKRTSYERTVKTPYGETRTVTWYHAVGHIDVKIFGGSDDDYIETSVPFEAQDNSDKLTNKIITNAERCLYRTLYAIDEGGEDPEAVNETNEAIKAIERNERKTDDKFFGKPEPAPVKKAEPKKAPAKPEEKAEDAPMTEEEVSNFLNVKGALPKFKEVVKAFKLDKGAKSVYDLSFDDKIELYILVSTMEEGS